MAVLRSGYNDAANLAYRCGGSAGMVRSIAAARVTGFPST
jgi:hypothetical protein